jgi:hypothetical protein
MSYINMVRKEAQRHGITRAAAKQHAARCDRARLAQLAAIAAFDREYPGGMPEA